MLTQSDQILMHLKHGPITPLEALHRYGCFRLAARILELREQGHNINVQRIELPNGKTVAQYTLGDRYG